MYVCPHFCKQFMFTLRYTGIFICVHAMDILFFNLLSGEILFFFFFFKFYNLFLKPWVAVYLTLLLARFYSRIYSRKIFRYECGACDFLGRFPTFRAGIASSIHHDDDADDFLRHWPFSDCVRYEYHLAAAYDELAWCTAGRIVCEWSRVVEESLEEDILIRWLTLPN